MVTFGSVNTRHTSWGVAVIVIDFWIRVLDKI